MTESTITEASVSIGSQEEAPIRVLHVDDDTGFLRVAKQCLEMQGHVEVSTALSVTEALKKLEGGSYDAIASDYQMPEKDGLEFLKELRENGNNIPFIIFTGKGREEVAIKALNLGADQYLNKFGDPATVFTELEHAIRKTVKSKRGEETQELIQKRLENVFAASPDAITVTDLNGNIIECNNATLELYGFSLKEEVIGKNAFEYIAESDRKRAVENMKKVLEQDSVKNVEYTNLRRDGSTFSAELSASVIRDSSGNPVSFVGITKDITERKKSEKALRKSEKFLSNVLKSFDYPIYVIDASDHKILLSNCLGENQPASANPTCFKIIHNNSEPCSDPHDPCPLEIVRESKKSIVVEHTHYDEKGGARVAEVHGHPILDIDGNVTHMIEYSLDITERKKAEEDLRQSEMKYRNIFELAPDGIMTLNTKGVITSINPAFLKLTGFSKNEVVGKHFTKMGTMQPRHIPKYLKLMTSTLSGKLPPPIDFQYNRKDGTTGWGEAHAGFLKKKGKIVGIQAFLREISENRRVRMKLNESEEKYKSLMEETPIGIINVDTKGEITYVNKRFVEITGYPKEAVLNKSMFNVVPSLGLMSDETFKLVGKRMKNRLMGKTLEQFRVPLRRKDGRRIWIEAESKAIRKFGVPVALQATFRDITELMNSEESLKETLTKLGTMNEKLTVVGGLTRHDIRNKLTTIQGRVFLANQKLGGNIDAQEDLVEAQEAIQETERILDFAREYESLGKEELAYVSVGNNVKSAVSLLPMAGAELEGVKIVEQCGGVQVLADSMLQQLFYNLIGNSVKHGEDVSQIGINCKTERNALKLIYEDNGVGVSKAEKEKIFEKGYGKGSGYGLYLIKKMCEVYGWTIKETGKQGRGAQFTITIPKLNEQGKPNFKFN